MDDRLLALAPTRARRPRSWARVIRRLLTTTTAYIVLSALGLVFLIPFLWLISSSLKPPEQLFLLPPQWIPSPFEWSNYSQAVTEIPFLLYVRNSLYVTGFVVLATVASSAVVAYGLARIHWPGRNVLFIGVLATLMIPDEVRLIPQFVLFYKIGWVNTFNPLTIPALAGAPVYIFLLRQFFLGIPEDLSDAARIDGAGEFQIFLRIILPLSKPALVAVGILTFVAQWNTFLGPLIYLNNENLYTLALGLYGFLGSHSSQWGLLMAAGTIMVVPVIVLFFAAQRTFVRGITLTGMRG